MAHLAHLVLVIGDKLGRNAVAWEHEGPYMLERHGMHLILDDAVLAVVAVQHVVADRMLALLCLVVVGGPVLGIADLGAGGAVWAHGEVKVVPEACVVLAV